MAGVSGMASAQGSDGKSDDERPAPGSENDWTNKEGDVVIPDSELEKWGVTVVKEENKDQLADDEQPESAEEVDIYVGKNKDSTPPSERITTSNSLPPTYFTLASGTLDSKFSAISGTDWELSGGIRFNAIRLEASVDITITIGVTDIEIWGVSIGPEGDRGYCTDISPGSFPLEVEPCIDLQFGAEEVTIGGSVNLCTPEVGKYEYCIGAIGFSHAVPVPEEVRNALP